MPLQDRTNEFITCVDSIRKRSGFNHSSGPSSKLLNGNRPNGNGNGMSPGGSGAKSEFTRMANAIGKDLSSTGLKLGKLGTLAKRKALFDDKPVEISELTFIIKQDIANINKQILSLQQYVKGQKAKSGGRGGPEDLVHEHNNNVVVLLQNKLANTSVAFKDVLEVRTQNMKESRERTEKFMYSTSSAASQTPPNSMLFNPRNMASNPNLHSTSSQHDPMGDGSRSSSQSRLEGKGKGRAPQNGDLLALNLDQAEEGGGGQGGGGSAFMQMQLMEQQDTYIQSRTTAIESIESTIAELGQIFTQLANMVAEQRETVQRIDADVLDIQSNVGGAQRELLKYYASISSNRWLMLKVFGVLIVFFLIFILVS